MCVCELSKRLPSSRTTHMAYHTVDNAKLNSDFDSLPFHGGLLDILSDLLGGL